MKKRMCKKIMDREEVRRKRDEEARRGRRERWQVRRGKAVGAVTEFWDEPCILTRIPVVFLGIRINNHQIL